MQDGKEIEEEGERQYQDIQTTTFLDRYHYQFDQLMILSGIAILALEYEIAIKYTPFCGSRSHEKVL